MRILFTGASGFVVSNALLKAVASGAEVVAVDSGAPDSSLLAALGPNVDQVGWRRADVTDREAMVRIVAAEAPDAVIHGAAITPNDAEERADPTRVFDVNAGGTLNLLEASRLAGVATFVFLSSTGLYGARPPTPVMREDEPVQPEQGYALAKLISEHLVANYSALTALRGRVARVATVYGPLEKITSSRTRTSSVQQAVAGAKGGRKLRVKGANIARDFVHADDVAEALWLLATVTDVPNGVYNVGPQRAAPLSEALDALTTVVEGFSWMSVEDGTEADLRQVPAQARAGLAIDRLTAATGWLPRYDLSSGAVATWQRYEIMNPRR